MGLLSKLKSVLGLEREKRPASPAEPDVTIEREPDAASERAVKGAGGSARPAAASEPATPSEGESEAEPESEAETATGAEAGADEGDADSPSVDEIDGIGPTYAERLADAGIETVADLADSDADTVAGAAETSQSRAEDWLEQARGR